VTAEHPPAPPKPAQTPGVIPPPQAAPAARTPEDRARIGKLMFYFGAVYVVEGMCQHGGIISLPLSYYLKEVHGYSPTQLSAFLAVFSLPWVIKPLYGLVSDFVPLLGYRRKTYLILVNALATVAYLWATRTGAPNQLLLALLLAAYGMAISSTLCGALLVENGQRYGTSGAFVNQQWLWFNIAAICAAVFGGQLVQHLSPTSALHTAAAIAAVAPLAVVFTTWYLVSEQKTSVNLAAMKIALGGLKDAFKTRSLWIVGLFLFLYYFSPGFATPLYYHMTDTLKFSQGYIGALSAISSVGSVVGALLYRRYLTELTSKQLLQLSIALGTVTTAAYLLLFNEATAAVLNFCTGIAGMIALVATLTLAADYCPKGSEGFSYAALLSLTNLASTVSDPIGSFLYADMFGSRLAPLVLVSAAFTAFAWILIPLLRLGDKPQGQVAHA
jgi:predicted MFS family arabinose efflux permease